MTARTILLSLLLLLPGCIQDAECGGFSCTESGVRLPALVVGTQLSMTLAQYSPATGLQVDVGPPEPIEAGNGATIPAIPIVTTSSRGESTTVHVDAQSLEVVRIHAESANGFSTRFNDGSFGWFYEHVASTQLAFLVPLLLAGQEVVSGEAISVRLGQSELTFRPSVGEQIRLVTEFQQPRGSTMNPILRSAEYVVDASTPFAVGFGGDMASRSGHEATEATASPGRGDAHAAGPVTSAAPPWFAPSNRFDVHAFTIPLSSAIEAARSTVMAQAFFESRPDAFLGYAAYDPTGRQGEPTWYLQFVDVQGSKVYETNVAHHDAAVRQSELFMGQLIVDQEGEFMAEPSFPLPREDLAVAPSANLDGIATAATKSLGDFMVSFEVVGEVSAWGRPHAFTVTTVDFADHAQPISTVYSGVNGWLLSSGYECVFCGDDS